MEIDKNSNSGDANLNDSWVELHFSSTSLSRSESGTTDVPCSSTCVNDLEKLLLEAQKESRESSRNSSRGSPKLTTSPGSPQRDYGQIQTIQLGEGQTSNEWVWDWSSRIEIQPPRDIASRYQHPRSPSSLSVRKSKILRSSLLSLENIPVLILSHACTFFLGAAAMFFYLKKYCKWSALGPVLTVD